jgi:signal transduction histidine kinase
MPHGYLLAAYLLTIAVYYTFLSAYLAGTTLIAVALGIQYMVLCWWYDSVDLDQAYAFFFLFSLIVFLHYAQLSQARLHRLTWLGSARAKQQQFRAEEIEVFRTQLLNLVGHDLRQPLGALRYYSAAYRIGASNLGADAGARSLLMADQISLALNQITEMLDKALELAQLDNDSVIARCRKQSVAPLVRQLLENFSTAAAVAGVEICIHGSGRVVLHDPALMLPVLRNLVSNVLQYHDHKAARPRVVVAFRGKNSDRIEIIDNGGGIPRHFLENPMQVRRQNETDTRSGLGLTIARHFAVKQGWQMDVVTYPGRGTCLRLHLPSEHVLRDQVSLSETMTRS